MGKARLSYALVIIILQWHVRGALLVIVQRLTFNTWMFTCTIVPVKLSIGVEDVNAILRRLV